MSSNSENEIVRSLAGNAEVQGYVGDSVSRMASNKDVQRSVGNALATAAEDRETQKRVASAVWSGAKTGGSAATDLASAAAKSYFSSE